MRLDSGQHFEVRGSWWSYLGLLRELLIEAEDNDSRLFSVLPLCTFDTKHVTVNPTNLKGVLQRLHRDFPDDYNDINFNNVTNVAGFLHR